MIASKLCCNSLHRLCPPTTCCWKRLKQVTTPSPPLRTLHRTWARSAVEKALAFADHLASVFQPHPPGPDPAADEPLLQLLEIPYQLELPIPRLTRTEIQTAIHSLNPKKSPGYDLLTSKLLQELPLIGIKYLVQLFDAVLLRTSLPGKHPNALPSVSCPLYPKSLKRYSSNASFH
jgi:hypothetical protein